MRVVENVWCCATVKQLSECMSGISNLSILFGIHATNGTGFFSSTVHIPPRQKSFNWTNILHRITESCVAIYKQTFWSCAAMIFQISFKCLAKHSSQTEFITSRSLQTFDLWNYFSLSMKQKLGSPLNRKWKWLISSLIIVVLQKTCAFFHVYGVS